MMFAVRAIIFLIGITVQNELLVEAKAIPSCGYGSYAGGYGGLYGSGYSNYGGYSGFPCPTPSIAPSPITFAPVPQPFPLKVPSCPPKSVTIPNIILALLPPTSKPCPKPYPQPCPPLCPPPPPLVLPLPQPFPVPVPDCDCR